MNFENKKERGALEMGALTGLGAIFLYLIVSSILSMLMNTDTLSTQTLLYVLILTVIYSAIYIAEVIKRIGSNKK